MQDTSNESASEIVEEEKKNEPVSRETRRAYVFFVTLFSLLALAFMLVFNPAGELALLIAGGLINIIELLIIMYVGASVIDRSEVLSKFADAISPRRKG